MATFYDTHAHLDYPDFANDLPQVLERAAAAGIAKLIAVGTNLDNSKRCVALADWYPQVFAAVGWHPNDAHEAPEDLRPALRELARHPKVVALGETGMDYYRLPSRDAAGERDVESYKRRQAALFEQHLEVAAELGLNVVVHQRSALDDTLAIMKRFEGRVRGQFHCFADDAAAMERILALGAVVSFTGILTYKNSENVRGALAAAPADRFMFETDCPFLVPEPHRANRVKRCEPAFVRETAALAASVRGCSLEQLSADSCATAERFFQRLG